ncbi:NlpC/P60 family protein [Bacillus sp. 1P06AnD]|uniref:NlpC/P60 family protein n=1 Tax=Bacillus sp. 1P06AnD TaxID=3132208 RepID=UPI00399FCD43
MSHKQPNDYQHKNGAQDTAKAMGKLAGKAGDKAKKIVMKKGKAALKKLAAAGLKKLASGILLKTAPIWGGALVLLLFVMVTVSVFLPDVEANKVNEYQQVATELGISPKDLLAFNTVLYENEDMDQHDPHDSAYYFIRLVYETYEPAKTVCEQTDPSTKKCIKKKEIPEKVTEHKEVQGKEAIQAFFRKYNLSILKITAALDGLRAQKNTRVEVIALSAEEAMDQAGFTEEQKQHFRDILEAGFLDEEFPDLGADFGVGLGASCSPTKEVNMESWNRAFTSAGAFAGYGDTVLAVSKKNGIDPVLMAAIAFSETGGGTSNAVYEKHNPGGLMRPEGGQIVFGSLTEGLESMGRTLHNRIIKDGLNTLEKLRAVYAPKNAANDPNHLNDNWIPNVTKFVRSLGGLTMNCETPALNLPGLENAPSDAAKIVASAGYTFFGKSTYVFGGGRSQSDINRGRLDCSSFVHWSFLQAGINLGPLTSTSTETLNKLGTRISLSQIQIGDLIFWDTYKNDGHVGIYIGNGQFIGCQTSTGVAIVNMNNPYWMSHFSGHVRRLLK